ERHSIWLSFAKASRVPSRGEQDGTLGVAATAGPGGLPVLVSYVGSHHSNSEDMRAWEAGYRLQAARSLSLDVAAFYNRYARLAKTIVGAPAFVSLPAPHIEVPIYEQVTGSGRT